MMMICIICQWRYGTSFSNPIVRLDFSCVDKCWPIVRTNVHVVFVILKYKLKSGDENPPKATIGVSVSIKIFVENWAILYYECEQWNKLVYSLCRPRWDQARCQPICWSYRYDICLPSAFYSSLWGSIKKTRIQLDFIHHDANFLFVVVYLVYCCCGSESQSA